MLIRGGSDEGPNRGDVPELPAWKAFVVQFSRDANGHRRFLGRVEHLSSGRRARFGSKEELVDILAKYLERLDASSDEGQTRG